MGTCYEINDQFLGWNIKNQLCPFIGSDTKELFEKNWNDKPDHWEYRKKVVSYKFNSLGHRSDELSYLDLDNYILTIGCSQTEGVGNALEDTYPYLVSKKLKCDYYNLSLGGTGIDAMIHNFSVWFNKIKKLPKFVVWQYPPQSRILYKPDDQTAITTLGSWTKDPMMARLLVDLDENRFLSAKEELSNAVLDSFDLCKVIRFSNRQWTKIQHKIDFEMCILDNARDDRHMGPITHQEIANKIISLI